MLTSLAGHQGSATARGINILLGIWLFVSAFVWEHTTAERTNTWILGILCVVFAAAAMRTPLARWLNTALAIWLFISVWALPHDNLATMWSNALVAIAVFVLSLVPGPGEHQAIPGHAPGRAPA